MHFGNIWISGYSHVPCEVTCPFCERKLDTEYHIFMDEEKSREMILFDFKLDLKHKGWVEHDGVWTCPNCAKKEVE